MAPSPPLARAAAPSPVLTRENFEHEIATLLRAAPELRPTVARFGPPRFWKRPERFETLVKLILEQQVSLASAATLYRRIEATLGGMGARRLAAAGPERLHALGMTRQKARYCATLGAAVAGRRLSLPSLRKLEDAAVIDALVAFPGIGPWTASTWLMLAMGRRDAWPPGDLALDRTVAELLPDAPVALAQTGERWRPRRAVAARLLWHHYLSTR